MLLVVPVLIGIGVGVVTSLIGASGVAVVVPLLMFIFGTTIHTAIGTSLLTDVIASISVSVSYYRKGNIDLKSGIWIILGSLIGSQVGGLLAAGMTEAGLGGAFGLVTVAIGLAMALKKDNQDEAGGWFARHIRIENKWQQALLSVIIGLIIGIISGIFGAGGGVLIMVALIVIMQFPLHKAIGTSTLIMAVTALSAATSYAAHGNLDLRLGVLLGLGSIVSGIAGSTLANKLPETVLRKVAGSIFVVIGLFMWFTS